MEQQILRVRSALDKLRDPALRQSTAKLITVGAILPCVVLLLCAYVLATALNVWTFAIGTLAMSSVLLRFGNMLHEAAHGTLSRSRQMNDQFGIAFAIITLNDFCTYKSEHLSHHVHLGDYDQDQDFGPLRELGYHTAITNWRQVALWFISTLNPIQFSRTYLPKKFWWSTSPLLQKAIRLAYVVTATIVIYTIPPLGISALVAMFIGCPLLKSWRDIVDHGGLYRDSPTATTMTRNFIVVNPILRWILWPRNDCYHLVHHLAPTVPVGYLHEAHTLLKKALPEYAELDHYAVELLVCYDGTHQASPSPAAGE